MFTYSLYGLTLRSNRALPMLEEVPESAPDVVVDFQSTDRQMPAEGAQLRFALPLRLVSGRSPLETWGLANDSGYWLRSMIGSVWAEYFLANDGSRIEVMVREDTPLASLLPPFLGLAIPLVLRLRGVTCLHASAVLVNGRVVVFAGPSEAGKSTTLLAMLRRRHIFFSDDLIPLSTQDGIVCSYGGYAQVGVLPDTMDALFGAQMDLPFLWSEAPQRPDMRIYQPNWRRDDMAAGGRPLVALYLLSRRQKDLDAVRITSVSPRDAIVQLVPHTTGRALAGAAERAADLEELSTLVRTVPIRLLERPDDIAQIDAVAAAIEADLALLAGQSADSNSAAGSP